MSAPAPIPGLLDAVVLTCPLGLRFIDASTGALVGDGLTVSAYPASAVYPQPVTAVVTPGGAYAFHDLPGLRSFANTAAADPWNPFPAATRVFQVQVTDAWGRFLPGTFVVSAPQREFAILTGSDSPPWGEDDAVPLFSAPTRQAPYLATVRAELRDAATGAPAAWALVEAKYLSGGTQQSARGLADAQGQLVLMLPFPEGQVRGFGASPPASGQGMPAQQWTLSLGFFHDPSGEPEEAADYSRRLHQPSVTALRGASPLATAPLVFGRELDLGSLDLVPI